MCFFFVGRGEINRYDFDIEKNGVGKLVCVPNED